jgi:hypothetical protein
MPSFRILSFSLLVAAGACGRTVGGAGTGDDASAEEAGADGDVLSDATSGDAIGDVQADEVVSDGDAGPANVCDVDAAPTVCGRCELQNCCDVVLACSQSIDCATYTQCLYNCPVAEDAATPDSGVSCSDACGAQWPQGKALFGPEYACDEAHCNCF